MKMQRLIASVLALVLILSLSIAASAAESSSLRESISFLSEHKDIIGPYHSMRFEIAAEKLDAPLISEEEKQQLTEYIIELRTAIENCLAGNHSYLIAIPDVAGPLDCTSLGVCEYCEHSEIVLTGDGYRERHRDIDKNGICDDCKREMPHLSCGHFCHSESPIVLKLLLPLCRIIWNLFGTEEYCKCGTYHFH